MGKISQYEVECEMIIFPKNVFRTKLEAENNPVVAGCIVFNLHPSKYNFSWVDKECQAWENYDVSHYVESLTIFMGVQSVMS